MTLTGLHVLLTYECPYECDHCFVWSGPDARGTFTLERLVELLDQAVACRTIEWVYFEGGEPFLYYPLLRRGVREAKARGFRTGIVTNSYWATSPAGAREALGDLAGLIDDLALSADTYHGGAEQDARVAWVRDAARAIAMPAGEIRVAEPGATCAAPVGQLPPGTSGVMFRGRAAAKLTDGVPRRPWTVFTACPHEDLREPGRVHVDPFGHVHVCQGISVGNVFETPLAEICARYRPDEHPIAGPILEGGPAGLAARHGAAHDDGYCDACHLCDAVRHALRARFPRELAPAQMYGVPGA